MFPAAPTRFSTSTGWPRRSASFGASSRELMSVGPPGAKGTTQWIGRLGNACPEPVERVCACAGKQIRAAAGRSARTTVERKSTPDFSPAARNGSTIADLDQPGQSAEIHRLHRADLPVVPENLLVEADVGTKPDPVGRGLHHLLEQ